MKQKILNLFKDKRLVYFLLVVVVLISLFIKLPKSEDEGGTIITNSKTTEEAYQVQPQSLKTYYVNKIDSKTNINGYSWISGLLIYSTTEGIFSAKTNQEMLKNPIKKIIWSKNGHALFLNDSSWNLLKPDGSIISLETIPTNISQNGKYFFHNTNNSTLISYTTAPSESISLKTLLDQTTTSINDKYIAGINNSKNLVFFNQDLTIANNIEVPNNTQLLAISPDGSLVALGSRSKLHLVSNQAAQITLEFSQDSKVLANWISNNQLFVIESYNNKLGMRIDEFWLVNNQGNRQYLASGAGIRSGLDNHQPIFPSIDNQVIPLIEFEGQLWLVSLKPNEIPIYNESGLSSYYLESKSDPHPELETNQPINQ